MLGSWMLARNPTYTVMYIHIQRTISILCIYHNSPNTVQNKVVKSHIFRLSWPMAVVQFDMAGNVKLSSIKLTYCNMCTTLRSLAGSETT